MFCLEKVHICLNSFLPLKKVNFNKMVSKRILSFNVDHTNLLIILVFPLVSYIKRLITQ